MAKIRIGSCIAKIITVMQKLVQYYDYVRMNSDGSTDLRKLKYLFELQTEKLNKKLFFVIYLTICVLSELTRVKLIPECVLNGRNDFLASEETVDVVEGTFVMEVSTENVVSERVEMMTNGDERPNRNIEDTQQSQNESSGDMRHGMNESRCDECCEESIGGIETLTGTNDVVLDAEVMTDEEGALIVEVTEGLHMRCWCHIRNHPFCYNFVCDNIPRK